MQNVMLLIPTSVVTASGMTWWAAESVPDPAGIGPYVGGGAGVVAVAALAEVLRRLLNGRLIPRETKDVEDELGAAIVAAGQREAAHMEAMESMRRTVERSTQATEDLRNEMRDLRRAMEGRT